MLKNKEISTTDQLIMEFRVFRDSFYQPIQIQMQRLRGSFYKNNLTGSMDVLK